MSAIFRWIMRQVPSRESLVANRFLRPFAQRQELWQFTRRSVPRGVAIGLWIGIFALIPGVQFVGAAMMCVPCRGNIPLAAGMTFLSNPATTPFIIAGAIMVGNHFGYHADIDTFNRLIEEKASISAWLTWLLSDAAPAMIFGLFVISTIVAGLGYVITSFGWRWWISRKLLRQRDLRKERKAARQ